MEKPERITEKGRNSDVPKPAIKVKHDRSVTHGKTDDTVAEVLIELSKTTRREKEGAKKAATPVRINASLGKLATIKHLGVGIADDGNELKSGPQDWGGLLMHPWCLHEIMIEGIKLSNDHLLTPTNELEGSRD